MDIERYLPRWSIRWYRVVRNAIQGWLQDNAARLAAGIAFFTSLSLTPLLTLLISVVGFFYGREETRGYLINEIEALTDKQSAAFIQSLISSASDGNKNIFAGVVSIGVLIWGATKLFYHLQEALNEIWKVSDREGKPLVLAAKDRLVAFSMTLVVAFLLLVSLVINAALAFVVDFVRADLPGHDWVWLMANSSLSFLTVTGLFFSLFKWLPSRVIPWKSALIGAFVASVLFSIGREIIGLYLSQQDDITGAAGSLIAVLLWVYFSAQIFFFGAEVAKAYHLSKDAKLPRKGRL